MVLVHWWDVVYLQSIVFHKTTLLIPKSILQFMRHTELRRAMSYSSEKVGIGLSHRRRASIHCRHRQAVRSPKTDNTHLKCMYLNYTGSGIFVITDP